MNAEDAVKFYSSVFKNSKVLDTAYYTEAGPAPAGTVLTINFELEGNQFIALNGGPEFPFTEAVSLSVDCKDQAEVDALWGKFTADGGEESVCGWLKDKFGLSWQIVPRRLIEMLGDKDPKRVNRVMQAMLKMRKIEVSELEKAYEGVPA
jgi:predicted 3-demethylubiquinone-9 3-methyltransferase (glyoxalase superfamily)